MGRALCTRTGEVKFRVKGDGAYYLVTSVSQIFQSTSGVFNPSSFRVFAYKGGDIAENMYVQCWGSTDNTNWTYLSYTQITSTNTYLEVTVRSAYKYYIVRLYDHNPSTNIDSEPNFYSSSTLTVIKDGEPGSQGNPGAKMRMRTWTSGTYYMRGVGTEEWYDVVEYEGRLYLCRVSHTASSSNSPATDTGYWEIAQNWTFIATKLLLAGKIVSDKITADLIDATNLVATDVDISGKITATSGKIGGWEISGNNLQCSGYDSKINVEASGTRFMRINYSETEMCYIRADESKGLVVNVYGNTQDAIGISVRCNHTDAGADLNDFAIKSYGNVLLEARNYELIKIHGLCLNVKNISASYTLKSYDDIIWLRSAVTVTVPLAGTMPGKIFFIKQTGGNCTLTGSSFLSSDSSTPSGSLTLSGTNMFFLVSVGSYWCLGYCG